MGEREALVRFQTEQFCAEPRVGETVGRSAGVGNHRGGSALSPKEREAIHHRQTASENILSFAALAFLLLFPFKFLFKAITPKTLILHCSVAHSLC